MSLTYNELRNSVASDAAGVRARTSFEPLGGPGDKVFPPTYAVDGPGAATKYAIEERLVPSGDGTPASLSRSVVLDSVASQANRLELALLESIRRDDLSVPVTSADFRSFVPGLDKISDYEAPHRIFDALLRDSYDGAQLFRNGEAGRAVTEAQPRDAAGLFFHSPHTLVFGGWDSTGPRGARGARYERAITSEIVAVGVELGVKTSSRIDPAGIELKAGPLFEAAHGTWTLDEDEAVRDDGKPKLFGAKGAGAQRGREAGRPSQANLGNVTPSIDRMAGGITARDIIGTTVLSFIQLRSLRFPTRPDGSAFTGTQRGEAELAGRTALAALGIAAATLAFEAGFDLRSRCVLVTRKPVTFEAVARDGDAIEFDLTGADAVKLVAEAAGHAAAAGLPWRAGELLLRPSDRLVELIRRSRALTAAGETDGE
jgi:CRISPR-associated protein Csb1